MRRLIPLMGVIYFLSNIDRANVSLAKGQLMGDLGISATVYGLGAGIFFLAYALLEVPSNLLAYRFGPRTWIARIAVSWGLVSACMMFVQGERSFYALRVLLGIAEAGLFPALMYMVTLWFDPKDRPVVVGWIYTAPGLSLLIGNPLGGALMQFDGVGGLHGWQWMFLLEGLPTVIVGIVLYFKLPERPSDTRWLTRAEAQALDSRAVIGDHARIGSAHWIAALKHPTTILIGLVYFLNQLAFVGLVFFTPGIIQQMHVESPFMVGLLASSTGVGFLLGVTILPRVHGHMKSDCLFLGLLTAGALVSASLMLTGASLSLQIVLLGVTSFFCGGVLPSYWAVAMKRLHGIQAAAGLAFINTLGQLGGFFGPYLFGMVETSTGKSASGLVVVVASACLGLLLMPLLARAIATAGCLAQTGEQTVTVSS
jgi:MFS family permease